MKRDITKKEFELFKVECEKWIKLLGLKSWIITILQKNIPSFGEISWSYPDRSATISLAKSHDSRYINSRQIKLTAVHECLELLLSTMQDLAECRRWDKTEWTKEHHAVIRTLEGILV